MNKWVSHYTDNPEGKINLYCFPHAGASSAFFAKWARFFPPEINMRMVQYPMRDNRFTEPLPDTIQELAWNMATEAEELFQEPFAFLGHCSGAVIAYETAQAVRKHLGKEPECLIVSSAISPDNTRLESTKELSEEEFCKVYQIPVSMFGGNEELKQFFMPIMRADFELCEKYRCVNTEPLTSPILVICGDADKNIEKISEVEDWRAFTTSEEYEFCQIKGDHFFIEQEPGRVCQMIIKKLLHEI